MLLDQSLFSQTSTTVSPHHQAPTLVPLAQSSSYHTPSGITVDPSLSFESPTTALPQTQFQSPQTPTVIPRARSLTYGTPTAVPETRQSLSQQTPVGVPQTQSLPSHSPTVVTGDQPLSSYTPTAVSPNQVSHPAYQGTGSVSPLAPPVAPVAAAAAASVAAAVRHPYLQPPFLQDQAAGLAPREQARPPSYAEQQQAWPLPGPGRLATVLNSATWCRYSRQQDARECW